MSGATSWVLRERLQRRAERAGVCVSWWVLNRAVDRICAQGSDPLDARTDPYRFEQHGPYVCPDCFCVGDQPHAPGCDESPREMVRADERDRCALCGQFECDCDDAYSEGMSL